MKLSIIIPVFNEKNTIKEIIKRVEKSKVPVKKEIIIIDDCSTDGTREILKRIKKHKIFFNSENKGKGYSVKKGILNSTGDIFIIQDADLEYNPNEYSSLVEPVLKSKTKVVYGSRLKRKNKRGNFLFFLGGKMITIITNILYKSKLTDEPTCYKVFHKDLKNLIISLKGNRFEWEPEITAKILRRKINILEIPISYNPRNKKQGKKIKFKDGLQAIWILFKHRIKKN